ncbi:MAG: DNRLRE domain-containing protein [Planctomycetota bacterium]
MEFSGEKLSFAPRCRRLLLPGLAMLAGLLVCGELFAASLVAPANYGELVRSADAVVFARARASTAAARGPLVFTTTEFELISSFSGPLAAGDIARVETPGGELELRSWHVPGSPDFVEGSDYLLCLSRKGESLWVPTMLFWGILTEAKDFSGREFLVPLEEHSDGLLPRPGGGGTEAPGPWDRATFMDHLREVLEQGSAWDLRPLEPMPSLLRRGDGGGAEQPEDCSIFSSNGRKMRWRRFDSGEWATIYGSNPGDSSLRDGGLWTVQQAMELWMEIPGTSFNLYFGGARDIAADCRGQESSEENYILFGDPCSDIADIEGCGGVLAYGGPVTSGTHIFDGERWLTITGWFVVVNEGVGCLGSSGYRRMIAHELGHGLGFGHVEDSRALMYASCCRDINDTDRACSRYAYPALSESNERPQASAGEDLDLVLLGNSVRLEGTVSDDGMPEGEELEVSWTAISGPGEVAFADPSAASTIASFSESGRYILSLVAHDGELLDVDQIELEVEVLVGSRTRANFQQGIDGYQGVVDTYIHAGSADEDHGFAESLRIDSDTPSGSGNVAQVLLRFESIFGFGPDQLPAGIDIERAWLELNTTNSGDGASVHRMLVPWSEGDTWNSFGLEGIEAGEEAAAAAEATVTGMGRPAVVDVTGSLRLWAADPAANNGWAFLPTGSDGWRFDSAEREDGSPPRLVVEYPLIESRRHISIGAEWDYFKGRQTVDPGWKEPGFIPGESWFSGPSGIGYGDNDDATVLRDMEDRYLTVYCRRAFEVANPSIVGMLELGIDYDDAFVAYLNGIEVARSENMGAPGSPVTRTTRPDSSHEAGEEEIFSIAPEALRVGENVLAIEVHNNTIGSGDLSMIPRLGASYILIEGNSSWSYLPGSGETPSGWNEPGFDDSGWAAGPAGIGYGDGDDLTELADMQGNYLSVFCRKTFRLDCPGEINLAVLSAIYDDGIVIYLNGVELARANMPAGAVSRLTRAISSVESAVVDLEIAGELLRRGENVLAVSVHNTSINSSDLTFMLSLAPSLLLVEPCPDEKPGPAPELFRRGDVSDEGKLDIADAVRILLSLFAGGVEINCPDAADVDDDGMVLVTDAVRLLRYLFGGIEPPPSPGIECGEDPTEDELGGCEATSCGA